MCRAKTNYVSGATVCVGDARMVVDSEGWIAGEREDIVTVSEALGLNEVELAAEPVVTEEEEQPSHVEPPQEQVAPEPAAEQPAPTPEEQTPETGEHTSEPEVATEQPAADHEETT